MSLNSLMTEDARRSLMIKVHAEGANVVQEKDNSATAALKALEKYIPTEVLALYIPAISIAPSFQAVLGLDAASLYWAFAALTVVFAMGTYMKSMTNNGLALPSVLAWPWWKALFAMLAYLVWGLTITANPYVKTPEQIAVTGFGALFVSIVLNFVATFFDPKSA